MYTDFYNLKEKPFNLTPSPRFLYMSESHKEALALLTYGVMEREGFTLLTGEVGTGKTTMVQALLRNLDAGTKYVFLSNPLLSPKDFREYLISSAFDSETRLKSKTDFLLQFKTFLKLCQQHNKNFILIIDEAQTLSFDLLEEVRLLSNMEYAEEKLISIFLIGQPEINAKLTQPRCRPLLQRISIRYQIPPLDFDDTREYVATRLEIAGAKNGNDIFSAGAIKAVHQYSEGYPRMINILADNALLLGYSKGKRKIISSMIKSSHEDLQLQVPGLESSSPKFFGLDMWGRPARLPGPILQSSSQKTEAPQTRRAESPQINRRWLWASALLFTLAICVFAMSQNGKNTFGRLVTLIQTTNHTETNHIAPDEIAKEQVLVKERPDEIIQDSVEKKPETPTQANDKTLLKTVIVKEGDTIVELAANIYGLANDGVLNMIKKYNPDIKDINRIGVGQKLIFPASPLSDKVAIFTVHVASFVPFEHAQSLFKKLTGEGYEAYIMPMYTAGKGKVFKITLGNFRSLSKAKDYAATILKKGIFDYAEPIQIEMR